MEYFGDEDWIEQDYKNTIPLYDEETDEWEDSEC